jgi:hypothetical protein
MLAAGCRPRAGLIAHRKTVYVRGTAHRKTKAED